MSETRLPDNVSPALARFVDVLCMYDLERFGPQLGSLLAGPKSRLDERTIMFRLAEHAIHVSAVQTLEACDRVTDAGRLRNLAPITDPFTASVARHAVDKLEGRPLVHARDAALFAAGDDADRTAPGRTAEHAAYAIAETAAACVSAEDARKVYDAASELLAVLRTGPAVA